MASRNLEDADPMLAAKYLMLRDAYEDRYPGRTAIITCTYRSPLEQAQLYAQGRTVPGPIVTQLDGVTRKSNHNVYPSRALDFAVVINGKVSWDAKQYEAVATLAEEQGLVAGAHWHHFPDPPHLELPGGNPA